MNQNNELTLLNKKTETMTFIQVLASEFYYLVEAIEHGSSDKAIINNLIVDLKAKTGYQYEL